MQRDGIGSETEYGYTQDGQLKGVRQGRGEKKQHIQEYEYNARGQIVGITDGVGETIRYGLDNWGRITTVGFSDGVKEGYAYTPSGQVSKAKQSNKRE